MRINDGASILPEITADANSRVPWARRTEERRDTLDEYMDVAKWLGKHRYIPKQVFMHNYVVSDPTADRNWIYNNEDEQNYNHRKQNHFYLDNI